MSKIYHCTVFCREVNGSIEWYTKSGREKDVSVDIVSRMYLNMVYK